MKFPRKFQEVSDDSDSESDASSLETEYSDDSGRSRYLDSDQTMQSSVASYSTRRQRRPPAKYMTTPLETSRGGRKVTPSAGYKPKAPVQQLGICNASRTAMTHSTKRDRLLMRPWLAMMADNNQIPNMCWFNEAHTQIKIPWKHGSRSCWTLEDCGLYKAWAQHTGKYSALHKDEPKRWKANFRCALNSLPDVKEVKNAGQTRGNCPFKVYELMPQSSKKVFTKKSKRYSRPKAESTKRSLSLTESSPNIRLHPAVSTSRKTVEVSPSVRQSPVSQRLKESSSLNVPPPQWRQVQQVHRSSSVIPTMVQELLDEEFDCGSDDEFALDEIEFAVEALQSELNPQRLWNLTTPESIFDDISVSSGYRTDSSSLDMVWNDIDIGVTSDPTLDIAPELAVEQTHAYSLLDNQLIEF